MISIIIYEHELILLKYILKQGNTLICWKINGRATETSSFSIAIMHGLRKTDSNCSLSSVLVNFFRTQKRKLKIFIQNYSIDIFVCR